METGELITHHYVHTVHEPADSTEGDGYDLLLVAVNNFNPEAQETGVNVTRAGRFLMSCLSERQAEVFEMVKTGQLPEKDSPDERLWTKIRGSILRHPSIIGKLAELSDDEGYQHLIEDVDDQDWKNEAACKGDTRFVRTGFRSPKIKSKITGVCANCPVLKQCESYVKENKPELAIWAGKSAIEREKEKKNK